MKQILQQLREDLQTFSKMNQTLFEGWEDGRAKHFKQGCVDVIERQLKQFISSAEDHIYQINMWKERMEHEVEQSKRR